MKPPGEQGTYVTQHGVQSIDSVNVDILMPLFPVFMETFPVHALNLCSLPFIRTSLLHHRSCEDTYYLPEDDSTVRQCSSSCVTSVCGTVTIPDEHLKVSNGIILLLFLFMFVTYFHLLRHQSYFNYLLRH